MEDALAEASPELKNRFISSTGDALQVMSGSSAAENTAIALARLRDVRSGLAELDYGPDVVVTGLTVLLAEEFPKIIEELRFGLLASVFLVVGIVALATRSIALALACIVPNILPVLFSEALIWGSGVDLSITNVVALTIGFGISIDNAIHVINAYRAAEGSRITIVGDVRHALSEVAPALFSGTAIICIATSITLLSTMPSIGQPGLLLIATLLVALLSNIAILPSAMILLLGAEQRLRDKGAKER